MDTKRLPDVLAQIDWAAIDQAAGQPAPLPDMATVRQLAADNTPKGNPAATKSISGLHDRRRASVDVYDDGEFVVNYRSSRLQDPDVAAEFETLTERVNSAGGSGQANASDLVALRDLVARWLLRLVYSWNLSDPITLDNLRELGLEMMMDVVNAIQSREKAKNVTGSASTTP